MIFPMFTHLSRLSMALVVTSSFALIGWSVGGVTLAGAAAGLVVAFLIFYGIGPAAFCVLLLVFVITWITTRLGRKRKERLGVAERRKGRRNAGQVLANIGVSGTFAAVALATHAEWAVAAAMAALAEAAADTSSSECGEAWSETAFLVPRLCMVAAGTDGAVTSWGTLAGVAAAVAVAGLAARLHVLTDCGAAAVGAAGVIGMVFDTVLGATAERRGKLTNNGVNLASTTVAALVAAAVVATLCR